MDLKVNFFKPLFMNTLFVVERIIWKFLNTFLIIQNSGKQMNYI